MELVPNACSVVRSSGLPPLFASLQRSVYRWNRIYDSFWTSWLFFDAYRRIANDGTHRRSALCVAWIRHALVFLDKHVKFLDGCDYYFSVRIFELFFQYLRRDITICCAFLKTVVLFHCLVIKVFTVHDKQYFSTPDRTVASWAVLKLVSVLPEPVVCQM